MSKRIIDLEKTAGKSAIDDYLMLDGVSQGTRKILVKDLLIDQIVKEDLDEIEMILPSPSSMEENTANLQKCLNIARDMDINITVKFRKGLYELTTCTIYDNTHIILTNNTTLKHVMTSYYNPETGRDKNIPILFTNAKPFDENDSLITGYKGRSNIHFEGGVIEAYNPFLFCHGENILIDKVKMQNTKSDHFMQIGSCKNVTIKDCVLEGMVEPSEDRNYVEMIQIDWMTSTGQPYWVSSSAIFDNGINKGITIDNCVFKKGTGNYDHMQTCIGSHGGDASTSNEYITIKNCKFDDYAYSALTLRRMKHVIVENNTYITSEDVDNIKISDSENISIQCTNDMTGGKRSILSNNSSKIKVEGLCIDAVTTDSDFMLFGECEDVLIKDITIRNSHSDGYNILIRNCSDVAALNCRDVKTTNNNNCFFRVYTRDSGTVSNIAIRNTLSDKTEVSTSINGLNIGVEEEIWSGNAISSGGFALTKDVTKFKNIKIYVNMYGSIIFDWNFIDNEMILRQFNLPDDTTSNTTINFGEMKLSYIPDINSINILFNNQVNISNGSANAVISNASIYKITGERIAF